MSTKSYKSKAKKHFNPTLGRASVQNKKELDLSHVRQPIDTSIFGLRQVLTLFQTATDEVKNYISYECDIMYECRQCRTIFRSLANFILHKRKYCQERFNPLLQEDGNVESNEEELEINKSNESNVASDKVQKKSIADVTNKLVEKQEIQKLAEKALNEDLSNQVDDNDKNKAIKKHINTVLLEPIDSSNSAVFQTAFKNTIKSEFMKTEVMEIHSIIGSDEAVLGHDGKICNFETNKKNLRINLLNYNINCPECEMKFSTRKTLSSHIKYKHNDTRLVYVCPDCKDTFANAWSVFRHLFKVHRKTSQQVKKMREFVLNSCIRKDLEAPKKNDKGAEKEEKPSEEDQWLDNVEEDNDLQMCGGCGKRFERKAALHSHSQMCVKRIAVCNTIKENNAKKKEIDEKNNKKPVNKSEKPKFTIKGSAKRKPYILRTYKSNEELSSQKETNQKMSCDLNANNKKVKIDNDSDNAGEKSLSLVRKQALEELNTEGMLNIIGIANDLNRVQFRNIIPDKTEEEKHERYVPRILRRNTPIKAQKESENSVMASSSEIAQSPESLESRFLPSEISKEENENDSSKSSSSKSSLEESILPKLDVSKTSPVKTENDQQDNPKRKRRNSDKTSTPLQESFSDEDDVIFLKKATPYMDPEKLECIPCQATYRSLSQLLWHMSAHFSWFRFQCSKCSFVTFNKYDCASHAKIAHSITQNFIAGVVLPIPNWKTVLISHDFAPLTDDRDLSGRLTDELMVENEDCELSRSSSSGTSTEGALFEDLLNNSNVDLEKKDTSSKNANTRHQNSIDVLEDASDIINETINIGRDTERQQAPGLVMVKKSEDENEFLLLASESEEEEAISKIKVEELDADDATNDSKLCIENTSLLTVNEIKHEPETNEIKESSLISDDCEKAQVHNVILVNERPIRNRTKSIKILQNDFLYDLTKVIKLNENKSKKGKKDGESSKTMKVYSRPKKVGK